MHETGYFELSNDSVFSYKLKEYENVKSMDSLDPIEYVKDIVFLLIDKLARILTRKITPVSEIKEISQIVVDKFGQKLSISSVAHFVHLIQIAQPPFDVEMRGFERRAVTKLLHLYCKRLSNYVVEKQRNQ